MLGCGDSSYRVDMTTEEANNLIKHLRQQINQCANSNDSGRVANYYSLNEINPDLEPEEWPRNENRNSIQRA
jgi:hypothetical protein